MVYEFLLPFEKKSVIDMYSLIAIAVSKGFEAHYSNASLCEE